MFRAGDHVGHNPSGEEWVLACDEENGEIIPAGWPEGLAKATDCILLKAATDAERLKMLRDVAAISGYDGGRARGGLKQPRAQRQLDAMEPSHLGVTDREINELAGLEATLTRAKSHLKELTTLRIKPIGLPGESPPVSMKSAQEALQDFAEHGTRFDLTPTLMIGPVLRAEEVKTYLLGYIKRIDDSVRERARYFLGLTPPRTIETGMVAGQVGVDVIRNRQPADLMKPEADGWAPGDVDRPTDVAEQVKLYPPEGE
jgi:hypothetical protein